MFPVDHSILDFIDIMYLNICFDHVVLTKDVRLSWPSYEAVLGLLADTLCSGVYGAAGRHLALSISFTRAWGADDEGVLNE